MTDPTQILPTKIENGMLRATNPRTGAVIAQYSAASSAGVAAAVEQGRLASQEWSKRPYADRAQKLRDVRNAFANAGEQIVEVLSNEIGRPAAESWFAEVIPNVELFDYWIKNAKRFLKTEKLKLSPINYPGKKVRIEYLPQGVIGLITPWNFPVSIPLRALVPALLAGNAVVWKPSEWSASAGQKLFDIFESHLPEGLLQIVHGAGETGAAVVEHSDYVIFTGSVATGRRIGIRCAERGIGSSLELGGKDAAYVAPDANLERTIPGLVWGAMNNAGQNCASVERIYVHKIIYDKFVEQYTDELKTVLAHAQPQVGPVINDNQAAIIKAQVDAAVASGATAIVGGTVDGRIASPTVLCGTSEDMDVVSEETFGPVVPIICVDSPEEAFEKINNSKYGLTCSIWTQNYDWAESVRNQLSSGVISLNNHGFSAAIPAAPWVGVRDSGNGVTNSHHALMEMVRARTVVIDRNKAARELWWYPYNDNAVELARTLVGTLLGKLSLYPKLIGLLGRRWKG